MFSLEPFVASLAALAVSLLASAGAYVLRNRIGERQERVRSELSRLAKERLEFGLSLGPVSLKRVVQADSAGASPPSEELLRQLEEQLLTRAATSPGLSEEDIQRELDAQLVELKDRLAEIEARFPGDAELEKISSINDALLSERINQLAKQVDALQERMLSRWDVALLVSTIIAGIAFVVGATYAALKVVGGS